MYQTKHVWLNSRRHPLQRVGTTIVFLLLHKNKQKNKRLITTITPRTNAVPVHTRIYQSEKVCSFLTNHVFI